MKAEEVAKYIIAKFDYYGDLITNKKLQKLLYYIEAWGLVHLNGVIDEDFEAWVYGPVVPDVYKKYSRFGYAALLNDDIDEYAPKSFMDDFISRNPSDICELIETVLERYGNMSAMELELLSHSEQPWKEARAGLQPFERGDRIISKETMKSYYSSLIDQ